MAIALGGLFGLRMIVTCGSDDKCTRALELGAAHAINYNTADFVEEVADGGPHQPVGIDGPNGEAIVDEVEIDVGGAGKAEESGDARVVDTDGRFKFSEHLNPSLAVWHGNGEGPKRVRAIARYGEGGVKTPDTSKEAHKKRRRLRGAGVGSSDGGEFTAPRRS
jgi:hypothetical protein